MSRISELPPGPYAKWVDRYLAVSRYAYSLLSDFRQLEIDDLNRPDRAFTIRMSLQAEGTSLAMRSALTHGLAVPALALLRVRLEQCVVSSFLSHLPPEDGWKMYIADVRAADFEVNTKMQDMAKLSQMRRPSLDDEVRALGEGAYIDKGGKFKRRWTDLSLENMAQRRDEKAVSRSPFPWQLAAEYWYVYPVGSLAIHGACKATFWNIQLHEPDLGSGQQYPYLIPPRAQHWAAALARYDAVQAWETLATVTTPSVHQGEKLLALYDAASMSDA